MKKYNKGMTIIEILISVIIISIVIVLLFVMLIQVGDENNKNNIHSQQLLNQSTFTKTIEEDIITYGLKSVSYCNIGDAGISSFNNDVANVNVSNNSCLKLTYNDPNIEDNIGYLIIYDANTKFTNKGEALNHSWMLYYSRGHIEQDGNIVNYNPVFTMMKEIPSDVDLSVKPTVKFTASNTLINTMSINFPVIDSSGEHFDIDLSYNFSGTGIECYKYDKNNKGLNCVCAGSENNASLCTNIIKDYKD